ncbi:hypothetical protein KKH36_00180 [Patescibacteria group bacterium]|nr:hypothetical protein [Patescibacteria group bacterium]
MKNKYKNLIFFQNGSIGDFLMTIFLLENIHLNDPVLKLFVVVPKNEKLLIQFLEKYPYINIILANRKSFIGLLRIVTLIKFSFSKNLVITAPTPGKLSLYIKIIARKISLFRGSKLIGFNDRRRINKFIYSELFEYDTKIIYPEFLKMFIKNLGFKIKKEKPSFNYSKDKGILEKNNLEKNKYIVFHTQGSSLGRSLVEKEIIDIIKKIKELYPTLKIVLTGGSFDENILKNVLSVFNKDVLTMINKKISELSTIIDESIFFIGVDTGTTHIASFLGKKSLVITHPATTPNWISYYNSNAKTLYSVKGCKHNIHEGREHLEKCRGKVLRCLEKVPLSIIEESLKDLLK